MTRLTAVPRRLDPHRVSRRRVRAPGAVERVPPEQRVGALAGRGGGDDAPDAVVVGGWATSSDAAAAAAAEAMEKRKKSGEGGVQLDQLARDAAAAALAAAAAAAAASGDRDDRDSLHARAIDPDHPTRRAVQIQIDRDRTGAAVVVSSNRQRRRRANPRLARVVQPLRPHQAIRPQIVRAVRHEVEVPWGAAAAAAAVHARARRAPQRRGEPSEGRGSV